MTKRVVVGISGASGAGIGVRILERLREAGGIETHVVLSEAAKKTLLHEVGPHALGRVFELSDVRHDLDDIGSSIASGSFHTAGMIVAPCSMRTLSAIAHSLSDNLLVRAADVHLKERRRLVLLARESPLHLGHLRAMVAVTEMGAIVAPPVPAFYQLPQTTGDIIDGVASRAIDLLALTPEPLSTAWTGLRSQHQPRSPMALQQG